MGTCDMCGSEGFLLKTEIEGTRLNVCSNCAKFGKVISRVYNKSPQQKTKREIKPSEPTKIEIVVENYSNLIKHAREKRNLKQEDLAKKIAEKESLIHNLESGSFKPSIALAKKLERFFHIKLVELYEENQAFTAKSEVGTLTIGDKIKIRKRT